MIDLSIVMPYYKNPSMLALHYSSWAGWPATMKQRVEVVIVDDGSPDGQAIDVPRPGGLPMLSIYRVLEDMPWHQHGARNLGAQVAVGHWLLLTDMDHMLTVDAARTLLARMDYGQLDRKTAYMLDRVEADTGLPTMTPAGTRKPHPNSFVMTRQMYWKIGGYDETFTGCYGTDSLFRHRAFKIAKRGQLDISLVRYSREIVPDASTTTLPRKEGREPGLRNRIWMEKFARGEGSVVKTLDFAWERVL